MWAPGPQPFESAPADVVINGIPMMVVRDDNGNMNYTVNDPQRFADKISTGDLRYQDFNPYESAFGQGQFDGGYGVRRLDDLDDQQQGIIGVVQESFNVDCRIGPAFLSPLVTIETLPGSVATPVWSGEFVPSSGTVTGRHYVCIAGQKVWYRTSGGAWTDTGLTLAANALQSAIEVAGPDLLIGYGAAHTAQYLTALDGTGLNTIVDTAGTPTAQYVWAVTTDHASAYIAGGPAPTNWNLVVAAPLTVAHPGAAFTPTAQAVVCDSPDMPITSLAPGGGIALLYIGKQDQLGQIVEISILGTGGTSTQVPIYNTLVPYDTQYPSNSVGMKWWMGTGGDEQRGPTLLALPRDRSPWIYQPNNTSAGQASSIAPWAKRGYAPPLIKGIPTAFQGTTRFLYYAITNSQGRTWILARDSSNTAVVGGATAAWIDLSTNACQTLDITGMFGANPLLFMGHGNNICSVIMPVDGDSPVTDSTTNCRFCSSGTLDLPDISNGFPDEDKIDFAVRVVHDNLSPGAQDIAVWASSDGAPYVYLGNCSAGNSSQIEFPTGTVTKRMGLRFVLSTTTPTLTPLLLAYSLRVSINPLLYREWNFVAEPAIHQMPWGGDDQQNIQTIVSSFWQARSSGLPFQFQDRWGDLYITRLLRFTEAHMRQEAQKPPEVQLTFDLLWMANGPGNIRYDDAMSVYDAAASKYS